MRFVVLMSCACALAIAGGCSKAEPDKAARADDRDDVAATGSENRQTSGHRRDMLAAEVIA